MNPALTDDAARPPEPHNNPPIPRPESGVHYTYYLHPAIRPPEFGGTGVGAVWVIDETDLPSELCFRQNMPTHGMIEPTAEVTLAEYQRALESTRTKWLRVLPQAIGDQP